MKFEELNLPTIWAQIKGYTNYQISICGKVKKVKTNRILKPGKNTKGYLFVSLSKNNHSTSVDIHRLVAVHFLPNIDDELCVDHKDNDRTNNTISNLRWCTNQKNCFNRSLNRNNISNAKGIYWIESKNKWRAMITLNKIRYHLGYFVNLDDAIDARQLKAHELFGEFVNNYEKIII